MIAPVAAYYSMYRANGSKYFRYDEEMISQGSILSGHAVLGTDHEEIGPFTNSFITKRALIWDKIIESLQGSDACTYPKPANKYRVGRLGLRII